MILHLNLQVLLSGNSREIDIFVNNAGYIEIIINI